MKMTMISILVALVIPDMALAHVGHDAGFAGGVMHPLTGADHLLAMLAVGLWAAVMGGRAIWALPVSFVVALGVGGILGTVGVVGAGVEPAILATVIILGAVSAMALRLPLPFAVSMVAGFGLLHGMAHGAAVAGPLFPFAAGFIAASLMLHLAGLALGRFAMTARILGAATALAGLFLAIG